MDKVGASQHVRPGARMWQRGQVPCWLRRQRARKMHRFLRARFGGALSSPWSDPHEFASLRLADHCITAHRGGVFVAWGPGDGFSAVPRPVTVGSRDRVNTRSAMATLRDSTHMTPDSARRVFAVTYREWR